MIEVREWALRCRRIIQTESPDCELVFFFEFRSLLIFLSCAMDIVPTTEMFNNMALDKGNHSETFKSYHWIFLALPSPLPETLIGNDPHFYVRILLILRFANTEIVE